MTTMRERRVRTVTYSGARGELREVPAFSFPPSESIWDRWESANERAEKLLLRVLDSEQRADYERYAFFVVFGQVKNRRRWWGGMDEAAPMRYALTKGWFNNVRQINPDGYSVAYLCAHGYPNHVSPVADNLITQKLMIETDEAEFLRRAFITREYNSGRRLLPSLRHGQER